MDQIAGIVNQVLPIFFLLALGIFLRACAFISESTIEELKKIVVNIALPAVLFTSFAKINLDPAYLPLSVALLFLCIVLYFVGRLIGRKFFAQHPYFPHMISGFEYGMLGVSLFGSAYGIENIGYIAIVDLGHEVYIWFFLVPILLMMRDGEMNGRQIAGSFLRNPVVLSIIIGIFINAFGMTAVLEKAVVSGAIFSVLQSLSSLTIPLILIIVGFGIRFRYENFTDILKLICIRYAIIIPIIFLMNRYVIRSWLSLPVPFEMALFTLLIMPSPFIIPLFMKNELEDEKKYLNNILAVQTLICVIIFTVYVMLHPDLNTVIP